MALRRITLRDFVIVQYTQILVQDGFTVLTGESGAGKSILVDALQWVLGARADSSIVREGARQADICAEFDAPSLLHTATTGQTLLLRRVIDTQGRSRAWINGTAATAAQLRALGQELMDIHGQHAWQSLTRADAVRALLDGYAAVDAAPLSAHWSAWRQAQHALQHARAEQDHRQEQREHLQWQLAQLDKLAPTAHDWEELNTQHTRLSHAQALLDAAHSALGWLENDDGGASTGVARAQSLLQTQTHLEPQFQAIAEVLASCVAQLNDARHSLHSYTRRTSLDPQHLAQLDEKLAQWLALARRFKRPPAQLPQYWQECQEALQRLQECADIEQLQATESTCAHAYHTQAQAVSLRRQQAAPQLAQAITQAMQSLGMGGGVFEVLIEPLPEPGPQGVDAVTFLVAGHPGATPRPLGKVASGGELSRIALAIAVTTSQLGRAPTLIFDEVDAGIGGAVADTVGQLMHQLGRDRQVLAVTHLPQVAAYADHHLVISKHSTKAVTSTNTTNTTNTPSTTSTVVAVTQEARVREIARMLGGERLSGTTLAHAREMLDPIC